METYVYITAETGSGCKDQTVFRLKIGGTDDGSDTGDPHILTVDGKRYDFQAVGEFMLLRDREGMEIQARQTPVLTANPVTDPNSGLTSCVSINTAIAARVGAHRISYQRRQKTAQLQFYIDGKPATLTTDGINLDGNHVSAFDADGETALRVNYAHGPVLTVTPRFWNANQVRYLNVSVSHTQADEGIMGRIPDGSWLPKLPSGATVGPKLPSLYDRYITLYKTFANAWRVTDATSLFVYEPGTSTATFTDEDWPAEKPPCKLKPQFEVPGTTILPGIPIADAEKICQGVTIDDLHESCVFDVATTGDESFAQGYLFAQDLRLCGTAVQIISDKEKTLHGEPLEVTAIMTPLSGGRPTPTGNVTFLLDGVVASKPIMLDKKGRAKLSFKRLGVGEHEIRVTYAPDEREDCYHSSSSPYHRHVVERGSGRTGCLSFLSRQTIQIILGLAAIAAFYYWA